MKLNATISRIADSILRTAVDDYQYSYDPEHRNRPDWKAFETEKGWSNDPKDDPKNKQVDTQKGTNYPYELTPDDNKYFESIRSGDMSSVQRLVNDAYQKDKEEPYGDYLYHGTPAKNIDSIRRRGLNSVMRLRNDFEDGEEGPSEQELLYFTKKDTRKWGGENSSQLRINSDMLPTGVTIREDQLRRGEFYAMDRRNNYFEIPPEAIDVLEEGKWSPLVVPDPIVKDDAGNIIPLSQRFNTNLKDTRN